MSTDVLTQLQTCIRQLNSQSFSTISYLTQRHPLQNPAPVPGQPFTAGPHVSVKQPGDEDAHPERVQYPLQPVGDQEFAEAKEELADDFVVKIQQMLALIDTLPGVTKTEEAQRAEVAEKVEEVEEMEKILRQKRLEVKRMVQRTDAVIRGMSQSISMPKETTPNTNGH